MAVDPQKKQDLLSAASALRQAEQALHAASTDIEDDTLLLKITIEYNHLDSLLQQIVQAQAIADDADFAAATTAIKAQASLVDSEEQQLKKIVGDVETAAQVVGYITKAIGFIAQL